MFETMPTLDLDLAMTTARRAAETAAAASDSRSATVTGERSGFSSTRTPRRKCFIDAAAAASAARRAVVIARSRSRVGMRTSIARKENGGPPRGEPPSDPSCQRASYFFGRMSPVFEYRVWKPKASSSMCGEWRPALGFAKARL